jgi:hypothetical protein
LLDRFSVRSLVLFGQTSLFAYTVHLYLVYHVAGPTLRRSLSPQAHLVYTVYLTLMMFVLSSVWRRWPPRTWLSAFSRVALAVRPKRSVS